MRAAGRYFPPNRSHFYAHFIDAKSKYIENEMVPAMVGTFFRIKIVPALVVDRNLATLWVTVVQTVVLLWSLKIVWVIDIRVIIETAPIGRLALSRRLCAAPTRREERRQQQ